MAKKLNNAQKLRASICFECGCIPSQTAWQRMCEAKGEDYDDVRYMADQMNIDDDAVVTIECLQSKEELHVVADHYNWDDNALPSLQAMIDHPLCDAGTALLLFWKGEGYRALSPNPGYASAEIITFFKTLYQRFCHQEFNSYSIAFDPYEEGYVPTLEESIAQAYFIPGVFFCPYSRMFVQDCL
ncbi:hypothetical protein VST7929_03055 [Vibrio stylophorae]|uniref:DUF4274 domain-containing protein n=1 Tax=Vibrio stylophorae TaxID=659351 RepID=A0ABN8E0B5_9VIBR|nr:DUF4274 domain-containing protein [Vibrio stylophorae]CAH0535481.1 hypothetical protein VST7929_03055 [Vibrio stylophorae]